MGVIEDVLKALERIPVWKRVTKLPDEMDALQKRVAALEAKLGPKPGGQCPKCGEMSMRLISSAPHPEFGFAGAKRDTLRCESCGFEETRDRGLQ
ncbi:hypothetical protein CDEF62S_00372 [Castellaniella defragrans]